MPDLPDELRALLRDRADEAPAVPAPTDRLVRTVRRRQAVRTSLALAGATLGVVAVVAVAAAAVRPEHQVVAPPVANPTAPLAGDKYEFCTGPVYDDLRVAVHATELKFHDGCYRVVAGAGKVTFVNPQSTRHNLVIAPEGGQPLWKSNVITRSSSTAFLPHPLTPGDYTLTCDLHPSMHAQLVVR